MHKVNDKSLARQRYEQKQNLWATLITTVSSTQSPNLVSNSCYFRQGGLCEARSCRGEALNLYAQFSKLLFFQRLLYPYPKF